MDLALALSGNSILRVLERMRIGEGSRRKVSGITGDQEWGGGRKRVEEYLGWYR